MDHELCEKKMEPLVYVDNINIFCVIVLGLILSSVVSNDIHFCFISVNTLLYYCVVHCIFKF